MKPTAACCPPATRARRRAAPPATDEALAGFAKALGHPVRVRILRLLIARQTCVCGAIVDHIPLAQSTVSQHLKILKQAGLIRGEIDGPRTCYCVDPTGLAGLQTMIAGLGR